MTDSKNQDAVAGIGGGGGASGPVAHTGADGTPTPVEPPGGIPIRVDRIERMVSPDLLTADRTMTGRQIRELRDPPIGADRDLFEIVPGGSDTKVEDGQAVVIRQWMRFFSAPKTINPGSPGGRSHLRATQWRSNTRRGRRDAAG